MPPGSWRWRARCRPAGTDVVFATRTSRTGWAARGCGNRLGGASLSVSSVPATSASDELRKYPDDLLRKPAARHRGAADGRARGGGRRAIGVRAEPGDAGGGGPLRRADRGRPGAGGGRDRPLVAICWGRCTRWSRHGKGRDGRLPVGTRGTPRHAVLLALSITVTHTAGVFLLGLAVLFAAAAAGAGAALAPAAPGATGGQLARGRQRSGAARTGRRPRPGRPRSASRQPDAERDDQAPARTRPGAATTAASRTTSADGHGTDAARDPEQDRAPAGGARRRRMCHGVRVHAAQRRSAPTRASSSQARAATATGTAAPAPAAAPRTAPPARAGTRPPCRDRDRQREQHRVPRRARVPTR